MRLAIYADDAYHRRGGMVYGERAFSVFVSGLRPHFERLVLVGRLSPPGGQARYRAGPVELLALPYYPKLSAPLRVVPALARSAVTFWRALDELDCVWLLGPHPLAIVFALLARLRGKRVVLGVRQDLPAYVRNRHPRRPDLRAAAAVLEGTFRALARRVPVVAIGPELAHKYRRSRALLEVAVSLVDTSDLVDETTALGRSYRGELRALSVGRIEAEKNPLLLADALGELNRVEPRWRLLVCGEGELSEELSRRLAVLGQAGRADLVGYVPFGEELMRLYRDSHVLLHTSWTEGLPQVLLEAFAAGLPVVASDVGGIRGAVGEAAILVPAGDPVAAAEAAQRIAADGDLRGGLITAGLDYVRARTREREGERVARFLLS